MRLPIWVLVQNAMGESWNLLGLSSCIEANIVNDLLDQMWLGQMKTPILELPDVHTKVLSEGANDFDVIAQVLNLLDHSVNCF